MVNKSLSDLGTRLDNFAAKPLRVHKTKMEMVVDAAPIEPVFTGQIPVYQGKESGICRVEGGGNSVACQQMPDVTEGFGEIPCENRTGILYSNRENFGCETGNRRAEEGTQLKATWSQ